MSSKSQIHGGKVLTKTHPWIAQLKSRKCLGGMYLRYGQPYLHFTSYLGAYFVLKLQTDSKDGDLHCWIYTAAGKGQLIRFRYVCRTPVKKAVEISCNQQKRPGTMEIMWCDRQEFINITACIAVAPMWWSYCDVVLTWVCFAVDRWDCQRTLTRMCRRWWSLVPNDRSTALADSRRPRSQRSECIGGGFEQHCGMWCSRIPNCWRSTKRISKEAHGISINSKHPLRSQACSWTTPSAGWKNATCKLSSEIASSWDRLRSYHNKPTRKLGCEFYRAC